MIRKIISSLAIFLILVFALTALVQATMSKPLSIIKKLNLADRRQAEDRQVVFSVNLLGFLPFGKATIENQGIKYYKGKKAVHLTAEAIVPALIARFFDVQARAESFVDKTKSHSLMFKETLIIPNKEKEEKIINYDQDKNIMELEGVERYILADTQDPLSAMYYMQNQSLAVDKEFDLNINTNQKNYRLFVKVAAKEEYEVNNKKVTLWVLKGDIGRRQKSPFHRSSLTIWLVDNPAKTPILIKAMTSAGSVTARLIAIE